MSKKFWTILLAFVFVICLASEADAQRRASSDRKGPKDHPSTPNLGDRGNGNQGEDPPGNGNQGEDPPGNGNQGEDPPRQTPDGSTPADEVTCDDLKGGTPGLYGLCVAFCEAHDCVPDLSASTMEERYRNCKKNDRKILEKYRQKMRDGDPDMPCVAVESACPCWGPQEIAKIPGNSPYCGLDYRFEEDGCEAEVDDFYEYVIDPDGTFRDVYFTLMRDPDDCFDGTSCGFGRYCDGASCPPGDEEYWFSIDLTPEEYDACKDMMRQIGSDYCY